METTMSSDMPQVESMVCDEEEDGANVLPSVVIIID